MIIILLKFDFFLTDEGQVYALTAFEFMKWRKAVLWFSVVSIVAQLILAIIAIGKQISCAASFLECSGEQFLQRMDWFWSHWRFSAVFIVNFGEISNFILVFLWLNFKNWLPAGLRVLLVYIWHQSVFREREREREYRPE